MPRLTCPNCSSPVAKHPENGCVLGALVQVVRDRGSVPERRLRKLHAEVNTDALWNDLGRVIDDLEEGLYSEVT